MHTEGGRCCTYSVVPVFAAEGDDVQEDAPEVTEMSATNPGEGMEYQGVWIGHQEQYDALDNRSDMVQYVVVDERYDTLKLMMTLLEHGLVEAVHMGRKEVDQVYKGEKSIWVKHRMSNKVVGQ